MREVCATCPDHDVANVTATLRKGSSILASAAATGVRLHHVPVHEPLVREGMHAEFRKAPAFEGDTVYFDIYANTGDHHQLPAACPKVLLSDPKPKPLLVLVIRRSGARHLGDCILVRRRTAHSGAWHTVSLLSGAGSIYSHADLHLVYDLHTL